MSSEGASAMGEENDEKSALVPRLRFPDFREAEAWSSKLGGVLFDQVSNKDHNSDLPVLAITQEQGAVPRSLIDYHVSVADKSIEGYKVVEVGDFIISLRSFQGGIEYSRYKGICSPAYVILRLVPEHSADYFRHFLKSDRFITQLTKNLEGLRDGKMVSYKQFSELQLPTPPQKEQQKIADCLSSLDELITAETQKLEALKAHKKGLMQQLFPREGETVPRLRFPEFLNEGEWKEKMLGEVADVRDGTHDSPKFFSEGKPLVTSKNLSEDGTLDLKNVSLICEEDYEQINRRSKVDVGDILFGMIGTIGNPVLVLSDGFAIKNVALIKQKTKLLNSFFVQLLRSQLIARKLSVINSGNSQKFVALGQLRDLSIPTPSIPEQQKVAACLSSLDDLITTQSQKIDALKTHKKGLMQQLFPVLDEVQA